MVKAKGRRAGAAAAACAAAVAAALLSGCSSPTSAVSGAARTPLFVPAAWVGYSLTGVAEGPIGPTATYVVTGAGGLLLGENPTAGSNPPNTFWSQLSNTTLDLKAVAYGTVGGSSGFVAVGDGGVILSSVDGVNWSGRSLAGVESLSGVCSVGASWVAVGPNVGTNSGSIVSSSNGTSWSVVSSSATPPLTACAAGLVGGAPTFVAVGPNGVVLTSPNGSAWTAQSSGTTANLAAVTFGGATGSQLFIAVGDGGTIVTSSSGTSWAAPASGSGTTEDLRAVAYGAPAGSSTYVAVGANGVEVKSSTGTGPWSKLNTGTTSYLDGVAFDGSSGFIAVGLPVSGTATIIYPLP